MNAADLTLALRQGAATHARPAPPVRAPGHPRHPRAITARSLIPLVALAHLTVIARLADVAAPPPTAIATEPLSVVLLAAPPAPAAAASVPPAPTTEPSAPTPRPEAARVEAEPPAARPRPAPKPRPRTAPKPRRHVARREPAAAPSAPIEIPQLALPAPDGSALASAPAASAPSAEATPAPPRRTAARFDAAYLANPRPVYPPLSRRLGEQGTVLLRVRVGGDGRAEAVRVLRSSGSPRLDRAAREVVSRWRFVPARVGEAAVASWVQVPIAFTLEY